jgi:hypothetical protein
MQRVALRKPGLGAVVGDRAAAGGDRRQRHDVHDVGGAALGQVLHALHELAGEEDRPLAVDRHDPAVVLEVDVGDVAGAVDAGDVDQDVEGVAVPVEELPDDVAAAGVVGHVQRHDVGAAARVGDQLAGPPAAVGVDVGDDDVRAGLGQRHARRPAQPAGTAGDQRHAALQLPCHPFLRPPARRP